MHIKKPYSIFKITADAIAALPHAVKLPEDNPLFGKARAHGCNQPTLVSTEYDGGAELIGNYSSLIGALSRLAYEDMQQRSPLYEESPLVFLPCHWTSNETGKRYIGLMVGTSKPDAPLPAIPVRQLQQSLKNVQQYFIGSTREGFLGAQWELVPTNLGDGKLEATYAWKAHSKQEIEQVRFMAEYAKLQGLYYKLDDPGEGQPVTLYMQREGLERVHRDECVDLGR